jgi:hypothetical protein
MNCVILVGGNDVELNWATGSEENNSHFIVEKSLDGYSFAAVGQQIQGAGTTVAVQHYSAVDLNLPTGVVYYRIKQIDFDGKFDYTNVEFVYISERRNIVVYPNPAKDEINIQVNGSNGESVIIMNLAGQVLGSTELSQDGFGSLNTLDYPNGIYFIQIESSLHSDVSRVIIQK